MLMWSSFAASIADWIVLYEELPLHVPTYSALLVACASGFTSKAIAMPTAPAAPSSLLIEVPPLTRAAIADCEERLRSSRCRRNYHYGANVASRASVDSDSSVTPATSPGGPARGRLEHA